MSKARSWFFGLLVLVLIGAARGEIRAQSPLMNWKPLSPIPDPEGFAAAFAGVSQNALVFGGGANIPADRWSEPFTKKWYDTVYILEEPSGAWKAVGKLPRPCAYGISITTDRGVICLGGSDQRQHFREVYRLEWKNGELKTETLPSLPGTCANACGALLGNTIYIAGGLEFPEATTALKTFWALDLEELPMRWRTLEPWPGPERMLAVAGAIEGGFYLFSGAQLKSSPEGKPVREFLRDAYVYRPGEGWKRIADLPRAAIAAASPAAAMGKTRMLILSGDDGANVNFQPLSEHPGFPKSNLWYEVESDQWREETAAPFSRATVPAVVWRGSLIVPNGEVRPRVRTPEVWALQLP